MTTFAELGLSEPILEALSHLGYEGPTPIQEQAIPALLEGRDVIGQAQTGTGKTAAFGLPMLEYVDPEEPEVQAIVLTPTRELCIQVTQALRAYGETRGIDVVAIFGGAPIRDQVSRLNRGRTGRRRDRRARDGHDEPASPDAGRRPLRRARRGRRDARPGLPRGRRDDPRPLPAGPADGPLLRDDPDRDQAAGGEVHARPGGDPGQGRDAHHRHRGPLLRGGAGPGEAGGPHPRAQGRAPGAGDRLRPHQDRRRPAGAEAGRRRG